LNHLHIGKALFGGISMGAGVSIQIAFDQPDRVSGLLLVRPAWLDGPMPAHAWFTTVARLIKERGPQAGRDALAASQDFLDLRKSSPDVAESLLRQFDAPEAAERVSRLETMPLDYPVADLTRLKSLRMPARVIATDRDPIHPLDLAERLAGELPNASFELVTAKSTNLAMHTQELRSAITEWIKLHGTA
jgi:pimeloyl-ACP methyl ester carboxylesterase